MRWSLPLLLVSFACRPEMGKPNYPDPDQNLPTQTNPNFLPGESPFIPGDERLSLGLFYEGGSSDALIVDDYTRFFYIWSETYTIAVDSDRVEGLFSDRISVGDAGWWGGGISWDQPEDLSSWSVLHLALMSPDAAQGDVTVHVESAGGTAEALPASDYGFQADGNWHYVSIPTEDFAIDWTQVVAPLALIGAGNEGEAFFVDDVYYGKGEQ